VGVPLVGLQFSYHRFSVDAGSAEVGARIKSTDVINGRVSHPESQNDPSVAGNRSAKSDPAGHIVASHRVLCNYCVSGTVITYPQKHKKAAHIWHGFYGMDQDSCNTEC